MIQILENNPADRYRPNVEGRRNVKSRIYDSLHVSPLHAKVIMIIDTKPKGSYYGKMEGMWRRVLDGIKACWGRC